MLIDGRHINTMTRRDGGPKPFRPENIITELLYDPTSDTYKLRLTDKDNSEFWIQLIIDQRELDQAIKEAKGH